MGKMLRLGACAGLVCCVLSLADANADSDTPLSARISFEANFDPRVISQMEIELRCSSGKLQDQRYYIENGGSRTIELNELIEERTSCQLRAQSPLGYHSVYRAKSKGISKNNDNGCQFARIQDGDLLICSIELVQDPVQLTAFKKWIGGNGEEESVKIRLECESGEFEGDRYINENAPAGWEISNFEPDGVVCSVFEEPGETYVADEFDCQGLVIYPGKGEECTMLNTKIVKRIEMLNRYGKAIMILVILVAGLIAVKRNV